MTPVSPAGPTGLPDRVGVFKNLFRHSAIYSIVGIVSRLVSVLMVSVYTRRLSAADYGVMELLDVTTNFIGALLGSRFGDALINSYFATADESARRRVVSTGFVGTLATSAALAVAAFFFSPGLSALLFGSADYTGYFRLTFVTLAAALPSEAAFAYIRALNRSSLFSGLQVLRTFVMVGLNLLFLLGFGLGLIGILYSALIGTAGVLVILAVFVFSRCGFAFDSSIFRSQVRFSLPLVISPAGMIFVHSGDRLFLKTAVSLDEIGIYALAYKIGMLVSYLINPVLSYWRSQMYDIMKTGADRVYPRLATYVTLFLVSLGLAFSLVSRAAVELLAGPAFQRAALLVPVVTAGYVMLNASEFFRSILLLAGKPGREARIMIFGTIFCFIAYATLIPRWKLWGAASASASTFAFLLVYGFLQCQKVFPVRLEAARILRIPVAAVASFAVYHALPRLGFWMEIGEASLCLLLYVAALVVSGFIDPEEWRQIRKVGRGFRPWVRAQAAAN